MAEGVKDRARSAVEGAKESVRRVFGRGPLGWQAGRLEERLRLTCTPPHKLMRRGRPNSTRRPGRPLNDGAAPPAARPARSGAASAASDRIEGVREGLRSNLSKGDTREGPRDE